MRFSLITVVLVQLVAVISWAQEGSLAAEFNDRGPSKWGYSYYAFSNVNGQALREGSPTTFTYNYLSANYKLSRSERINIRPVYGLTTTGFVDKNEIQKGKVELLDFYLNYANRDLALLPGDWQLMGEFRVYFPTSQAKQDQKTIVYLRQKMISEKSLGKGWFANYTSELTYYVQSQKAYRKETTKYYADGGTSTRVRAEANKIGDLDHRFGIGKYINKIFTPKLDVGFVHEWDHTSDQVQGGSASSNEFKISPNTEIHVTRDLWFILGVESKVDINDTRYTSQWEDGRGQSINMFRPENTQYFLMTFLTI